MIVLDGVSRHYRTGSTQITALDNVSLSLVPGALHALVGPSGSGKSTLLNVIIGAEQPDSGHVRYSDGTSNGISERWDQLAFVPQGLGLMTELTLAENVGLPLRLGHTGRRSVDELMTELAIDELGDRFGSDVSLGEQQRAAIARALITDPAVLIADEPTAHQDEGRARAIMAQFRALADEGSIVLMATHERRILDEVDVIVMMEDGHLKPQS